MPTFLSGTAVLMGKPCKSETNQVNRSILRLSVVKESSGVKYSDIPMAKRAFQRPLFRPADAIGLEADKLLAHGPVVEGQ